jgi:Skp family chaperone for outer membrane proteins
MNRSNLYTLLLVSAVAAGFWLLQPTHADPAPAAGRNNIAVVNIPLIFRSSKETIAMNKELEERTRQIEANTRSQADKLKKMDEDIRALVDKNGPDFKDKMRALTVERIRMDVTLREEQWDLMTSQQLRAEKFYGRIIETIQSIAVADGYDVVLFDEDVDVSEAKSPEQLLAKVRQRKVLYNSARSDITKKVLDRLDVEFVDVPKK